MTAQQVTASKRARQYGHERDLVDPSAGPTTATTFLERKAIGIKSGKDYAKRIAKFVAFCALASLSIVGLTDLDLALTMFLNEEYFDGEPGTDASKNSAAVVHLRKT